ncbi:hypothetical protein [Fimbriiglobus ruber]|nr:hypothetical protein [Fimbriiglobus ruber]
MVVNPVTQVQTTQTITGTSHTFAAGDNGYLTLRSNSGTLMTDTLPGTSPGVLAQGWSTIAENNDTSALYAFSPGSGTDLNGSSTGTIILGPGQRCAVFSDGSNYWAKDLPGRTRLGANATFYVSTTGSDSNTGLASGTPWATIQHAITVLANSYDLNGFTATISLANGTYSGTATVSQPWVGGGVNSVLINGNSGSPSSTIISGTVMVQGSGSNLTLENLELANTSNNCLQAEYGGVIQLNAGIIFGTSTSQTHMVSGYSAAIIANNGYTISGNAAAHIEAESCSTFLLQAGNTVTLTGTPAFSNQFAFATAEGSLPARPARSAARPPAPAISRRRAASSTPAAPARHFCPAMPPAAPTTEVSITN